MKVSELRTVLDELQDTHGDVEVIVSAQESSYYGSVAAVYVTGGDIMIEGS